MGDFVGGIEIPTDKYPLANGDYCIVELTNDQLLIRQFFIDKGNITLHVKALGEYGSPLSVGSTIKRVCPIIFHRKLFKYMSDNSDDDIAESAQQFL
jgi:hypothetical protein